MNKSKNKNTINPTRERVNDFNENVNTVPTQNRNNSPEHVVNPKKR